MKQIINLVWLNWECYSIMYVGLNGQDTLYSMGASVLTKFEDMPVFGRIVDIVLHETMTPLLHGYRSAGNHVL